ncbi:MAG: HAMP domain-containing histidine kinase [Oscillospiraceae bacterium]|nr:HAMP domain-containing histidine kinase [Oscillospiraceae bacterium]
MKLRGLSRRRMFSGIAVVPAAVLIAIAAFSIVMFGYCRSIVKTGLEATARSASVFFKVRALPDISDSFDCASEYIASFEDKSKLDLQFLTLEGRIIISAAGMSAGGFPNTGDIAEAIETKNIGVWSGRSPETGERIMAASCLVSDSGGNEVGIMRYVTGLRLADRQALRLCTAAVVVGIILTITVILSNAYFIRAITEPITELTDIAKNIARGSYGVKARKTADDEIGDLTDAVNEMSDRISQADKMQTEFISSVSHELRTPLTAINGWSETLMYDPKIRGDSRAGLEIITKEAAGLTKMVEDLLEFTGLSDARFNINAQPTDAGAQLEDAIATYSELLRKENIELEYRPSKVKLPEITGDPARLKQVFLNIIDNAAKYGRVGRKIIVSSEYKDGCVIIIIRDFGPGIPEDDLPFVKKKFYKGGSKERGSGIGLAVCDEIITRHNGKLLIANAMGGGVAVTVTLPCPPR